MQVAVTGATGLIGRHLCSHLHRAGHELVCLARRPESIERELPFAAAVAWDAVQGPPPAEPLRVDAVVHLAGESIAAGRWTRARKRSIRDSRVLGTKHLVQALAQCRQPPAVLIQGSAIGCYGDRGEEPLDEASPPGRGFLAEVCQEWEAEGRKAELLGMRVVLLRTGLVLSTDGGALPRMMLPFRLFAGGPLGDGRQYLSWIHIRDEVGLIEFALQHGELQGPVNATAPNPVTNREFARLLGNLLRRPAFMTTPGVLLRLLLGEMAQALLLSGQRVFPRAAQAAGFHFRFPELKGALQQLLG